MDLNYLPFNYNYWFIKNALAYNSFCNKKVIDFKKSLKKPM